MTPMDVRLKYLISDRDERGNVRFYVRVPGMRKVRIRGAEGSREFLAAYSAATGIPNPVPAPAVKTLRWLFDAYLKSADFNRLDIRSQRNRIGVLESCLAEPRKPGVPDLIGECPLASFGTAHIRVLRDRRASQAGAANNRLKYLSSMFGWAAEAGYVDRNPVRDVKRIRYATDGFHTWSAAEIEQYRERHPPGTKPRLALALLLFTGGRRGDIVTLGRQHVRDGWLRFVPAKTRRASTEPVEIPVLPELAAEIAAAKVTGLTFLLTEQGKPFTPAGFGGWFKDRCIEAGLPHCSCHGLRKAGASIVAENGATEEQLRAIYHWATPGQSATYTRRARKRLLTAALPELFRGAGDK